MTVRSTDSRMKDLNLALMCLAVLALLATVAVRRKPKINATRIGIAPGPFCLYLPAAKRQFATNGHRLVEQGYIQVSTPKLSQA